MCAAAVMSLTTTQIQKEERTIRNLLRNENNMHINNYWINNQLKKAKGV